MMFLKVSIFWICNFCYSEAEDGSVEAVHDRMAWEQEQKQLDRAWYDLDSGYDESNNPFSNVSESYTQKKEEALKKLSVKRKSARARQVQKVKCMISLMTLHMKGELWN